MYKLSWRVETLWTCQAVFRKISLTISQVLTAKDKLKYDNPNRIQVAAYHGNQLFMGINT